MNKNTPHHQPTLQEGQPVIRHRRQGSLLVLVVVCLVLMALLGAAYLQVARVDRLATADQYQTNINQVANATINYIAKVLRNDIVDNNGGFFAQASGTAAATYTDGTGNEAYDYPWTNPQVSYDWPVKLDDGTLDNAQGGIYDDTWLSSSFPTFAGTAARWDHITNLMGTYLQLPSTTGAQQPTELPTRVADGTAWRNDSNVPISNTSPFTDGTDSLGDATSSAFLPLGIDTDLDGIPDAKWQWAVLRQIGSVKYVMAVRIVDNGSLININTASALSSDGDNIAGTRGYLPTDIDLSRIVKRVDPSTWRAELASSNTLPTPPSLFQLRGLENNATPATALPTPLGTLSLDSAGRVTWPTGTTSRAGAWFENVQLWSIMTNKLSVANEIELRRLGGVNNANVTVAAENAMPTLLRAANVEMLYNEPTIYSSYSGFTAGNDLQYRLAFFQGSSSTDRNDPAVPVANRDFPSLRNQLTTHSAAALYASNAGQVNQRSTAFTTTISPTPPARTLKYDLVNADGKNINNNVVRTRAIRDRLFKIFRISATSTGSPTYLPPLTNTAANAPALSDVATEFALAIQAYSDPGSTPTSSQEVMTPVPPNTATPPYTSAVAGRVYYSLETLPFFREGYMQAAYQNRDLLDGSGNPGTNNLPDTLVYEPASVALAFEIGNPFDRTINFDDLTNGPAVRVVIGANTYDLTGTIDARQTRIFHASRSTLQPEGNDTTGRGNLVADLNIGSLTNVTALTADPVIAADTPVTFELQVEVPRGSGNWVTYDRLGDATLRFDGVKPTHYPSESAGTYLNKYHHEIQAIVRPCTPSAGGTPDIYYISNRGKTVMPIAAVPGNDTFPAASSHIGQDDKGAYGVDNSLTGFQIPIANRQFLSVAELGWILTFGFYTNTTNPADNLLGDFPSRMDTIPASDRFLQIDTANVPTHATMQMPHGALVFEQFTTLSPRNDGEDNDGDGVNDNEAEQVVRGQININTAPLHILTLASPLLESIGDAEELMKSIIQYRDDPTVRAGYSAAGANTRPNIKGIASIGELMLLNNTTNLPDAKQRMDGYTSIAAGAFSGSDVDLYPMPENVPPTTRVANLDAAGREQQLARFQFLSQVFNTRSDVYTAFVRLRGYPAQDFSKGEVESLNFLVVYDRSNIVNPNDMPKILGVYLYNVP